MSSDTPNGLRNLASAYDSDGSDDESDTNDKDDSSSTTVSSISSTNNNRHDLDQAEIDDEDEGIAERTTAFKLKTEGELLLEDLPPIEDLKISFPANTLVRLGTISAIVDKQVVIQSAKGMPPLNIDSVLFAMDGTAIGQIFDVLGPVTEPLYCVRFNNQQDIAMKQLVTDLPIYFVPSADKNITNFVFVEQLKKMKGSDASWTDNNEPPEYIREYSDDEEEQRAKSKLRNRNNNENQNNDTNSRESLSLSAKRTRHGRND